MHGTRCFAVPISACLLSLTGHALAGDYNIVDTGQTAFYNNTTTISAPSVGDTFYGQDAQFTGNTPSYTTNGDGLTVLDNVTNMTWTQTADLNGDGVINTNDKLSFSGAQAYVNTLNAQSYGGYNDWQLPSIKQLYSLIQFTGIDPSGYTGTDTSGLTPFIDDSVFGFDYGDQSANERIIDAQFWSSTEYVSTTMNGDHTVFGVNFADGRIKGYGTVDPMSGGDKTQYVYFVRGNTNYGINDFTDNGDGTISDDATSLMWAQDDSGAAMDWEDALGWVQQKNDENYLGHDNWRLPNVKEMQSIVDYTRSPDTTSSAAIDPVFNVTSFTDDGGETDYPQYWTGTTHANMQNGNYAAYVCFGEAQGWMATPPTFNYQWLDVHGAGAQRSDPKSGTLNTSSSYYLGQYSGSPMYGHGPQGDVIRIDNYVRLVRDDTVALIGDLDGDGFVGLDDLDLILNNWNQNVTAGDLTAGDTNGDGFVGLDDLDTVLNNWNTGTPPAALSTLLPEPTTALFIAASSLLLITRRAGRQ